MRDQSLLHLEGLCLPLVDFSCEICGHSATNVILMQQATCFVCIQAEEVCEGWAGHYKGEGGKATPSGCTSSCGLYSRSHITKDLHEVQLVDFPSDCVAAWHMSAHPYRSLLALLVVVSTRTASCLHCRCCLQPSTALPALHASQACPRMQPCMLSTATLSTWCMQLRA